MKYMYISKELKNTINKLNVIYMVLCMGVREKERKNGRKKICRYFVLFFGLKCKSDIIYFYT